jgi:hypothetical protein
VRNGLPRQRAISADERAATKRASENARAVVYGRQGCSYGVPVQVASTWRVELRPVFPFRRLLPLLLLGILAGCASLPPPAIPVANLKQYRIASVEVRGTDKFGSWPAIEEAYLKSVNATGKERARILGAPVSKEPALAAYAAKALQDILQHDLPQGTADLFGGPKPVTAIVTVLSFDVPSTAQRILIGGSPMLIAEIRLVEPNGAVVLASPNLVGVVPMAGGIAGVVVTSAADSLAGNDEIGRRLVASLVLRYHDWLAPKS